MDMTRSLLVSTVLSTLAAVALIVGTSFLPGDGRPVDGPAQVDGGGGIDEGGQVVIYGDGGLTVLP